MLLSSVEDTDFSNPLVFVRSLGGVLGGEHKGELSGVPVGENVFDPVGDDITLGVKLIMDEATSFGMNGELSLVPLLAL